MNLRERAALAYLDEQVAAKTMLLRKAEQALADVLDGAYRLNPTDVDLNKKPPEVTFEVDGLTFKVTVARIQRQNAASGTSNPGMEWEDEEITVYVERRRAMCPVRSLADIGREFRDEELPTADEEGVAA